VANGTVGKVLEPQFSLSQGFRAFIGDKSLNNYLFWAASIFLVALLAKEFISPTWVQYWSHPQWGSVQVDPVKGVGIGLLAGFMGGAVGAFISLFSIPLYTLWLGLPVKVAMGTNSLASAVIGLFAAWMHFQKKTPNLRIAWPMMLAGLIGAGLGAFISLGIPNKILKMYFSILVFLAAGWMIYRVFVPKEETGAAWIKTDKKGFLIAEGQWRGTTYRTDIISPAVGNVFIALISGIVGVGGGFLFTPMLNAVFGIPLVVAVGTGNFVKVANIGSQFIVRGVAETVIYPLAIFAMCGGYCGARLGRRLALAVNPKYLRIFFGLALIYIGLQYVGIKFF
jgi:uncharacterized membrane protein YfcA